MYGIRAAGRIGAWLDSLSEAQWAQMTELRLRLGQPTEIVTVSDRQDADFVPVQDDLDELVAALSGYARYAVEREMALGYIPIPGGHRAGVCGRLTDENGQPVRMSAITSLCIRVAHPISGASTAFRRQLLDETGSSRRVLIIGPPGCGKTTALRDAALWLSDVCGRHVVVCDERGELFAQERAPGCGRRLDVLRCAERGHALMTLLRTMAPEVIVTDELGTEEDVRAIGEIARCGIGLLATAHGSSLEDICHRPSLKPLWAEGAFHRIVQLCPPGRIVKIYDAQGRRLDGTDELGYGSAGADGRCGRGRDDCGGGRASCTLGAGDAALPSADE